jgi:hypothetical protein
VLKAQKVTLEHKVLKALKALKGLLDLLVL